MRLDLVLEPDTPDRFKQLGLLAEKLGFGCVWTANHVAAPDPFMAFMPLAEAASSITMGPVAVSPFELHPVKIANQLLTLNHASGGKARVVVGGGWRRDHRDGPQTRPASDDAPDGAGRQGKH